MKLSSALPKGDEAYYHDGLHTVRDRVLADPSVRVVAVVELRVARVTHDLDSGNRYATLAVERIEPCSTPDAEARGRELLDLLAVGRTGRQPALFRLEDTEAEYLSRVDVDDVDDVDDGDDEPSRSPVGSVVDFRDGRRGGGAR